MRELRNSYVEGDITEEEYESELEEIREVMKNIGS